MDSNQLATPHLIAAARSMVTQHCLHGQLGYTEWKTALDALGRHYAEEVGDPKDLGCQDAFNLLNSAEKLVNNGKGNEVELMPLIQALDAINHTVPGSAGQQLADEMPWEAAWNFLQDGFFRVTARSA